MLKVKIKEYLLEIVIFLIGLIIGLTITNWSFIESNAFIILAVILFVTILVYMKLKSNREIKEYENTLYHLIYGIPYDEYISSEFIMFECYVFERLQEEFGAESLIFIQKFLQNDELSMVGMMMYHPTGVYCIELRSYEGLLIGNNDSNTWRINNENKTYEVNNAVKYNQVNIDNLNLIHEYDYNNVVILSDTVTLDSKIDNVYHLEDFIEMVNSKVNIYNLNDFNEIIYSINEHDKEFNDSEDLL